MSDCPNCGGDVNRGRWAPGGCTCKREPERNDGDIVDEALEVASKWDYITPAAESFGISKYLLVMLALAGIVFVFASHGILWG